MEKKPSVGEVLLAIATVLAAVLLVLSDLTKEWPPPTKWALLVTLLVFFFSSMNYFLY